MHIPVRLFNQFTLAQMIISMLWLFLLGVLFSFVFLRTKNMVSTGLAHGSWNEPFFGVQGDFLQILALIVVGKAARRLPFWMASKSA